MSCQQKISSNPKSCCVTGHRVIEVKNCAYIESQLRDEIHLAIKDGYTHFISGFAQGVDLMFASIIAELKESHGITLEAAIPYRNRCRTKNRRFNDLIKKCDIVGIHSETYSPACFQYRNRFMVNMAERVIAVYDGRKKGGTFLTIHYASKQGRELRIITVNNGL